jgi:hypothetical protein
MKAICNRDSTFTGKIPDFETYEKVRMGAADWNKHIKPKLESVTIPYDLFIYFMSLDNAERIKKIPKVYAEELGVKG